jgi:hypothetical protein
MSITAHCVAFVQDTAGVVVKDRIVRRATGMLGPRRADDRRPPTRFMSGELGDEHDAPGVTHVRYRVAS